MIPRQGDIGTSADPFSNLLTLPQHSAILSPIVSSLFSDRRISPDRASSGIDASNDYAWIFQDDVLFVISIVHQKLLQTKRCASEILAVVDISFYERISLVVSLSSGELFVLDLDKYDSSAPFLSDPVVVKMASTDLRNVDDDRAYGLCFASNDNQFGFIYTSQMPFKSLRYSVSCETDASISCLYCMPKSVLVFIGFADGGLYFWDGNCDYTQKLLPGNGRPILSIVHHGETFPDGILSIVSAKAAPPTSVSASIKEKTLSASNAELLVQFFLTQQGHGSFELEKLQSLFIPGKRMLYANIMPNSPKSLLSSESVNFSFISTLFGDVHFNIAQVNLEQSAVSKLTIDCIGVNTSAGQAANMIALPIHSSTGTLSIQCLQVLPSNGSILMRSYVYELQSKRALDLFISNCLSAFEYPSSSYKALQATGILKNCDIAESERFSLLNMSLRLSLSDCIVSVFPSLDNMADHPAFVAKWISYQLTAKEQNLSELLTDSKFAMPKLRLVLAELNVLHVLVKIGQKIGRSDYEALDFPINRAILVVSSFVALQNNVNAAQKIWQSASKHRLFLNLIIPSSLKTSSRQDFCRDFFHSAFRDLERFLDSIFYFLYTFVPKVQFEGRSTERCNAIKCLWHLDEALCQEDNVAISTHISLALSLMNSTGSVLSELALGCHILSVLFGRLKNHSAALRASQLLRCTSLKCSLEFKLLHSQLLLENSKINECISFVRLYDDSSHTLLDSFFSWFLKNNQSAVLFSIPLRAQEVERLGNLFGRSSSVVYDLFRSSYTKALSQYETNSKKAVSIEKVLHNCQSGLHPHLRNHITQSSLYNFFAVGAAKVTDPLAQSTTFQEVTTTNMRFIAFAKFCMLADEPTTLSLQQAELGSIISSSTIDVPSLCGTRPLANDSVIGHGDLDIGGIDEEAVQYSSMEYESSEESIYRKGSPVTSAEVPNANNGMKETSSPIVHVIDINDECDTLTFQDKNSQSEIPNETEFKTKSMLPMDVCDADIHESTQDTPKVPASQLMTTTSLFSLGSNVVNGIRSMFSGPVISEDDASLQISEPSIPFESPATRNNSILSSELPIEADRGQMIDGTSSPITSIGIASDTERVYPVASSKSANPELLELPRKMLRPENVVSALKLQKTDSSSSADHNPSPKVDDVSTQIVANEPVEINPKKRGRPPKREVTSQPATAVPFKNVKSLDLKKLKLQKSPHDQTVEVEGIISAAKSPSTEGTSNEVPKRKPGRAKPVLNPVVVSPISEPDQVVKSIKTRQNLEADNIAVSRARRNAKKLITFEEEKTEPKNDEFTEIADDAMSKRGHTDQLMITRKSSRLKKQAISPNSVSTPDKVPLDEATRKSGRPPKPLTASSPLLTPEQTRPKTNSRKQLVFQKEQVEPEDAAQIKATPARATRSRALLSDVGDDALTTPVKKSSRTSASTGKRVGHQRRSVRLTPMESAQSQRRKSSVRDK